MITWDSRILPSPLLQSDHNFPCCWHCSFFHGSCFPIPGCFSSFTSSWHVFHQTCDSHLGCFIVASGESSALPLADSFSACLTPRRRLRSGLCFVLQTRTAEYFLHCCEPSVSRLTSRDSAVTRGSLAASPAFTLFCVASS